jgi:hypothetical protein
MSATSDAALEPLEGRLRLYKQIGPPSQAHCHPDGTLGTENVSMKGPGQGQVEASRRTSNDLTDVVGPGPFFFGGRILACPAARGPHRAP